VSPPALTAPDETRGSDGLTDLWRDTTLAVLGFWGRLGRLALESVAALAPLAAELRSDEAVAPATPARPVARTILVEAEAGQSGLGVFLVENTTTQQLSIPVSVSTFFDEEGREVRAPLTFRPDVLTLDPGDQLAVQVAVAFDETLEPDVRYHGEISLPGLSATRIPIVVRRRAHEKRQGKATTRAA
jgi:hypothetical protein